MAARVLVVEDHAVVRRGLCALLQAAGIEVVADVGTGEEALAAARDADVLLLDLGLPDVSGLEVLRRLPDEAPDARAVVLTMHGEEEYVMQALAAGADGYVLKTAEPEAVTEAIQRALRGEVYLDPTVALPVVRRAARAAESPDELTPREEEILALIARGLTNRQIAEQLFISVNTVETHRRHLLEKLGARSRAELVSYAIDRGLLA